jgi:hypothetical protein
MVALLLRKASSRIRLRRTSGSNVAAEEKMVRSYMKRTYRI